jgi:spore coat protein U-like protein
MRPQPLLRFLLALLAMCAASQAHAAITCSISSSGFATAYDPNNALDNVTQTFFTVTCTRGSTSDPTTVSYGVKVDNGLYATGQKNRAAFGGNRIRYDVFKDAGCNTTWKGNSSITDSITFTSTGTVSKQSNFWGCVLASQSVAAGTYTDTVTMTLTYGASNSTDVTVFGVSISTPAQCSVSSPPGNVVLNYVAFGALVNSSTTLGVTCTLSLPYSLALDATSGTIAGLNYTLALSPLSSVGTGVQQSHTVTGTIAAGQAGTCAAGSCTGTRAHSVTITY